MKIIVGCPVASRAWCLQRWLDSIHNQTVPVEIHCLVSESNDGTETILAKNDVSLIYDVTPPRNKIDIDKHYWGDLGTYAYMATIRNRLVTHIQQQNADYFFSLDSDILVPPTCLEQLLEGIDKWGGIAAPFVSMSAQQIVPNAMHWVHPGVARRVEQWDRTTYVDVVMAAMLLDSQAMECRWAPHPQGEDLGFCLDAAEKHIPIWWNPTIKCTHLMEHS